jgi:hypothetical protein
MFAFKQIKTFASKILIYIWISFKEYIKTKINSYVDVEKEIDYKKITKKELIIILLISTGKYVLFYMFNVIVCIILCYFIPYIYTSIYKIINKLKKIKIII